MKNEYYSEQKFRNSEIIKMALFFPIIGGVAYFLSKWFTMDLRFLYWIGVPIAIFAFWNLIRVIQNKPNVTVSKVGVQISSPVNIGLIEWGEIKGIRIKELRNKSNLCLDLKDPEDHKKKLNFLVREFAKTSEKIFKTHVVISEKYAFKGLNEIKEEIEKRLTTGA